MHAALVHTARRLWVRYEPYHDVTYFTPESRAATDALGCKGGWMGYFGMRAAPLGAASADEVTVTFHNFRPSMVRRAIPDAWAVAPPAAYLDTRLAGVDAALRRMLGPDALAGPDLAEAAALATEAAMAAATADRPLAAGNAALDWPREPHLALWHATTVLRESRGDGHVLALRAADLDPCQTLVIFAAEHGIGGDYLRLARGWTSEEWSAAESALRDRGLLDDDGALTPAGAALRHDVEHATDEAALSPWDALGADRTDRLAALLEPLARRIADANEAMTVNPMALDARAELAPH